MNALIDACIKRDRKAQKELYKMHFSYAMNICMRYSQSVEEAKEIMNDGFMKVFQYLEKFDRQRPFKPWLSKILITSAIDHFNKNNRYKVETELEEGIMKESSENILDTISYEEMLEIVRKLPLRYQTVFNLKAIEGYKHEEIAQMLGISVGASKSNYAKAKQKLQSLLSTYFGVTNE